MFEVQETETFTAWFEALPDERARKRIAQRIARLRSGLFGDAKYFNGIGELRVDYGPGYRVYFVRRGNVVVILLCGGNKSSQDRDIKLALEKAKEI